MTDELKRELTEIEATQAALRQSIEATKGLAQKAETLLKKHKDSLREIDPSE
jgi:hypothetical protein